MATYQPFEGYATAYATAVKNVMKDIYDPEIIPTVLRCGDITKYFQSVPVAFPKGKSLIVRVSDAPSQTARWFGTPFHESGGVGRTLPNPAMSPTWNYWKVEHDDLMGLAAGIRYAFPTDRVWDDADVSNLAESLSKQSAEDVAESVERGLITRQAGEVCKVVAITNSTAAYAAGSVNWSLGSATARLWVDQSAVLLHQGAVIDIVHKDATYASSLRHVTVKGVGMQNPTDGVYGYIDIDATYGTSGVICSTLAALITAATPAPFVYLSGEYPGTIVPDTAPADTSGYTHIYSLQDWFKSMSGSGGRAPGTIYNTNRATIGNQWALPVVVDKNTSGSDVTLTMDYVNSLLTQLYHKRLDMDKLTNYVILAGPVMVEQLTQLTASANRRVDGATAAQQSIVTNYGFDGFMMHHPTLGTPVAIQPVRGLPENMIFVLQPGVCEMLNLGPPSWFPWTGGGETWMNESYTTGAQGGLARTMLMRADRLYFANSLIRAPLWNGALLGVKP